MAKNKKMISIPKDGQIIVLSKKIDITKVETKLEEKKQEEDKKENE